MRGDNETWAALLERSLGPPPRAWGQLRLEELDDGVHRSTPTCVGTTPPTAARMVANRVHPHVRGDNGPAFT